MKTTDLVNFKGVHYNYKKVIDFKHGSDEYEEFFLNYFKLFVTDCMVPTKFDVSGETDYAIDVIEERALNKLFDIIYKKKKGTNIIEYDAFCFDDDLSLHLQNEFKHRLQELAVEYSQKNINVKVFVLLKYIQHRAPSFEKGHQYKVEYLSENQYLNDRIFNINIANFCFDKSDLVQLQNVFLYILKFSQRFYTIIAEYKECCTEPQFRQFFKACLALVKTLNNPSNDLGKNSAKAFDFLVFENMCSFDDFLAYLENFSDVELHINKNYFDILCSTFIKWLETSEEELNSGVKTLSHIISLKMKNDFNRLSSPHKANSIYGNVYVPKRYMAMRALDVMKKTATSETALAKKGPEVAGAVFETVKNKLGIESKSTEDKDSSNTTKELSVLERHPPVQAPGIGTDDYGMAVQLGGIPSIISYEKLKATAPAPDAPAEEIAQTVTVAKAGSHPFATATSQTTTDYGSSEITERRFINTQTQSPKPVSLPSDPSKYETPKEFSPGKLEKGSRPSHSLQQEIRTGSIMPKSIKGTPHLKAQDKAHTKDRDGNYPIQHAVGQYMAEHVHQTAYTPEEAVAIRDAETARLLLDKTYDSQENYELTKDQNAGNQNDFDDLS